MTKVLIGSQALAKVVKNCKVTPKDTDYFSDHPVDGAEVFWHPRIAEWWTEDGIATLDELYTIKISHIFWTGHSWSKHYDHIRYMQTLNALFIPGLYGILYPVWEERFGKKKVNLEAPPEEFFNARIARKYEHDSVHQSVAYYSEPLFKQVLRENSDVAVDWNKFRALTYEDKLNLVREETYATALERTVIPSDYTVNPRVAYNQTLKLILTSLWKGRWALWVAQHISELHQPDINYVEKHLNNKHLLKEEK